MASLMVLHVTLEQRAAVKNLFASKSWTFLTLESRLSSYLQEMIVTACRLPGFEDGSLAENTELESIRTGGIQNNTCTMLAVSGDHSDKLKVQLSEGTTSLVPEHQPADLSARSLRMRKRELQKKVEFKASTKSISKSISADDNEIYHNQNKHDKMVSRSPCSEISSSSSSSMITLVQESVSFSDNTNKETNIPDALKLSELRRTREAEFDRCKQTVQFNKGKFKLKGKFNCENCNYTTNIQSNLNRHVIEVHRGIRHKCTKCHKSYKSRYEANMHKHLVHSKGPQCSKCDRIFTSSSGLRNHIKTKHENKALYQCTFCKMAFFYKTQFTGHVNKHLNLKPFVCQQCQKPFRYKGACKLHEKLCSGETYNTAHNSDVKSTKPKWLCDVCGAELVSKSSLKMHHLHVHSEDTRAVCSQCGKSFKGAYSLRRHMKTSHEDDGVRHPCSICGKLFAQVQILKQHMKIHQKAYTSYCDTCGKGFLTQFKMLEHCRSHSGVKPFACPVCLIFKCSTKSNLQKHIRTHEKDTQVHQRSFGKNVVTRKHEDKQSKEVTKSSKQWKTKRACDIGKQNEVHSRKSVLPIDSRNKQKKDSQVPDQWNVCLNKKDNILFSFVPNYEMDVKFVQTDFTQTKVNEHQAEHEGFIGRLYPLPKLQTENQIVETGNSSQNYHNSHAKDYTEMRHKQNNTLSSGSQNSGCSQNSDAPEFSQGLNILTVALNMINPP